MYRSWPADKWTAGPDTPAGFGSDRGNATFAGATSYAEIRATSWSKKRVWFLCLLALASFLRESPLSSMVFSSLSFRLFLSRNDQISQKRYLPILQNTKANTKSANIGPSIISNYYLQLIRDGEPWTLSGGARFKAPRRRAPLSAEHGEVLCGVMPAHSAGVSTQDLVKLENGDRNEFKSELASLNFFCQICQETPKFSLLPSNVFWKIHCTPKTLWNY